jgi:hypothetical protein
MTLERPQPPPLKAKNMVKKQVRALLAQWKGSAPGENAR